MPPSTMFLNLMLFCITITTISADSITNIPALLWSPERSMTSLPDASQGSSVNAESFHDNYLIPLMKNVDESAVVFLQDKLHVDDFTKYADVYSLDSDGGAFKNIKAMMEEHFSLEIPEVKSPLDAIQKLKKEFLNDGRRVEEVTSLDHLVKLNLKSGDKVLILVHLSPVSKEVDPEEAIRQNDAMMGAVCKHLQKRSIKYTALLTGKNSADAAVDAATSFHGRRLLEEASENNGTFMNVSGMFIYMREAYVCLSTKDNKETYCPVNFTLAPTADTASQSVKDNKTATITLRWQGVKPANLSDTYNIQIDIHTQEKSDRWVLQRMSLTTSGGNQPPLTNATIRPVELDPVIPILYSFHCTQLYLGLDTVHEKSSANSSGTYVQLRGFQLQPFNVQQDRFFNAQDCVGFFTSGTWMGLFPTIIMVAILLFGTLMVLNLSTMDKYDDPKGKTIYVPQSND